MTLTSIETDVAIIGVGSAGMAAYKAARRHTDQIVAIEHGPYGTTCARVGCMPSKLLIAAAQARHDALAAPRFGVHSGNVTVDGAAVMQRVREERDRFAQFSIDDVAQWPHAHRLRGTARFVAPGELQVGDHTRVKARSIIIATGTSPRPPEDLRAQLGDRLLINDDVFDWQTLPQSVAVMGTGAIGLELAHALRDLGVRVLLLGRNGKVGPVTDPDVIQVANALATDGLQAALRASHLTAERHGNQVVIHYESEGRQHQATVDYLLAATGRQPNLAALDLPAAGIAVDDKGMPAFDALTRQIEGHPVFIAGDVNLVHPVLHEASDDGFATGHNAAQWPQIKPYPRRATLSIVFSRPQMTLVGTTFKALQDSGRAFESGAVDFRRQGRARIDGVNAGILKVYGEPQSQRFLGAEMVGPAAEHIGHLLAWALQQQLTVDAMLASPFYHPVIEEGLRTALRQLRSNLG